ncbi:hypothetical protein G6F23_015464 [Rhizopus arrhizus]|nr:hypothetical protein G6F23_015464 [Rhizopus arrhizus]
MLVQRIARNQVHGGVALELGYPRALQVEVAVECAAGLQARAQLRRPVLLPERGQPVRRDVDAGQIAVEAAIEVGVVATVGACVAQAEAAVAQAQAQVGLEAFHPGGLALHG